MPDSAGPESRFLDIAQARVDRLCWRVGGLARDRPIPAAELDGILVALDSLRARLPRWARPVPRD